MSSGFCVYEQRVLLRRVPKQRDAARRLLERAMCVGTDLSSRKSLLLKSVLFEISNHFSIVLNDYVQVNDATPRIKPNHRQSK
jgi:hypothetical protein